MRCAEFSPEFSFNVAKPNHEIRFGSFARVALLPWSSRSKGDSVDSSDGRSSGLDRCGGFSARR